MICIYSPVKGPRFRYTMEFIFRDYFRQDFEIIHEKIPGKTIHINYSTEEIPGVIHIIPYGILEYNEIRSLDVVSEEKGKKLYCKTGGPSDFTEDIFSAVFYWISRYEEYVDPVYDVHGRFMPAGQDIQDFRVPRVNLWLYDLHQLLRTRFSSLNISLPAFQPIATIDVDNDYDFKGKGLIRGTGGLLKDLLKLRMVRVAGRLGYWAGLKKDPYDHYEAQIAASRRHRIFLKYFMLSGKKSVYDGNISAGSSAFKKLSRQLAADADVGLHPSYRSHQHTEILNWEKQQLENASGTTITSSRQHFLKFTLPETYRNLLKAGIREDWSMGYAGIPGYRAGVAFPYYWYDLEKETSTVLKIYPLAFMEVTYRDYLKTDVPEAESEILQMMDVLSKTGGTFVFVWHDRTFEQTAPNAPWYQWFYRLMERSATYANG